MGREQEGLGASRPQRKLRLDLRFPVRIAMAGYEVGSEAVDIRRMVNGQADVVVYTGENRFLNALAAAWMRLMSVISYGY